MVRDLLLARNLQAPPAGGMMNPNENDISTLLVFFISLIRTARLTAQADHLEGIVIYHIPIKLGIVMTEHYHP